MVKKGMLVYMYSTRYSCMILMTLEFSRRFFEKYSNIKFHGNPSSGIRFVPCGLTDMTKLIAVLRNFANASLKMNSAEDRVRSAASPCNIYDGQTGILRVLRFSPGSSIPPMLHTHSFLYSSLTPCSLGKFRALLNM